MSASVRPEPIDPELLAKARLKVREARKRGFSDADIDAYLRDEIGASLTDVVQPNERDFWRTVGSGVTLGFGDELAGLLAKMGGGSYRHARDAAREESAGFRATNPKLDIGTEIVSGGLPALLTTPIFGPAGWLGRMGQAAGAGAATGTVAGVGHSEGESAGDVAKDAAKSALISAAIGSLLSGGASVAKVGARRVRDAIDPSRPVVREAATQLPPNAAQMVARQESLAPGTAVLADVSPEMQSLTRGVGADAKTGVAARTAAEGRTSALKEARRAMGPKYDALNKPLPIDNDLREILASAGRANVIKNPKPVDGERIVAAASRAPGGRIFRGATHGEAMNEAENVFGRNLPWREADQGFLTSTGRFVSRREADKIATRMAKEEPFSVDLTKSDRGALDAQSLRGGRMAMPVGEATPTIDFSVVQRVRSQLRAEARATRNDAVKLDKLKAADRLTAWLKQHAPEIEKLDADYAFLTDRTKAAGASAREITNSSKNYAASRAYGSEAGSIGGSLPQGSRGIVDVLATIARPNRAARARAANRLLLTPGDATNVALQRIQAARAAMDAPPSAASPFIRSLLFGDIVPNAGLLSSP